ncbi:aspartyl-tRNA synthetase [Plectosphaerella plurivora]|uniref:Probable aspartate--tRNA ligase, cytoplasmic n=1 Tax=Plectosphaerella plurivora TaxID=936078 RepID=A0A9P8VB03_9PEZI|nr:aspartyl-tRNA synthetase [Plectosphaerella plurivora]
MATTDGTTTTRSRPLSGNPFARIAHKIASLKSGEAAFRSQSQPNSLEKTALRNSVVKTGSGDLERLNLKNTAAAQTQLRDGIQSDPDVHHQIKPNGKARTITPPASSRQSSQTTRSQPSRIQRDDEEPEPRESMDRYGSERYVSDSSDSGEVERILSIAEVTKQAVGSTVTFRARIHTQRRMSRFLDFILFRDQTDTIQGVLSRAHPNMVRWVQHLHPESIVQVTGTLQKPVEDVRSALHSDIEVNIDSVYLVSSATQPAFSNYRPPEAMNKRLNARILDLRHPSNQALFRVRAAVTRTFRNSLENQGFMEMQTPKLQPAATESGAAVFKVNYFGRRAFLAQSPQLAKQMAISADFGRVYEIGPVFRAENSNTHRHLTEYTGLDIEMALINDYHEMMSVVDSTLKDIFRAVQSMPEMKSIRERWPSEDIVFLDETPILIFKDAIQMLRDDGRDVAEEDLSTRDEIRLGELVKEKYKTDYYILDKFPKNARPFYTHPDDDPQWTNSFDIFVRGQEICTGGQRIHDPELLRASMADNGVLEEDMAEYLSAFDLGAPPHGGAGLGLDRLIFLLLQLGDIRYATLFFRDPKSLPAKPPSLPHPTADTTKSRVGLDHPPIEELIANYGDASNTSWLDERFKIWRHHTGAAVGYVPQGRLVMVIGDPLCDARQYKEVATAFIDFCLRDLKLTPIWMLVSVEVEEVLGKHLGWRTLSCTEEQRTDGDHHSGPSGREARRMQREGVKVHEVRPDDAFRRRADESIVRWKASRKGKQVHLTEVRPWVDTAHRRYFAAEKDGVVHAMVVLHQLAPRHGWQVKWALDFPGSPNGAIEVTVEQALSTVPGAVTFGVGVSDRLTPGEHLGGARARFLAKSYDAIVKSLGLGRKAEFREKFGVLGEQVYICYPKHDISVKDLREIVKFFED